MRPLGQSEFCSSRLPDIQRRDVFQTVGTISFAAGTPRRATSSWPAPLTTADRRYCWFPRVRFLEVGCSPLQKLARGAKLHHHFAFPVETCFTYTNLTNPSANPPMDLSSQIVRGVCLYNPGFKMAGFNIGRSGGDRRFARTCLKRHRGRRPQAGGVRDLLTPTSGNLLQVFR